MGRKKKLKIPKSCMIKCSDCGKRSRVKVPENEGLYHYECKKCKKKLEIPASQCCLICAYSNKRCVPSLKRQSERR
ncbi:GDCCVxC domain-containing (seleno)protein [Nanoarchaeota archaeon]